MSNYFNMGKLAVEKGPKIVRKVKQAIQTTKSPIKQAVETIKATFKPKPKKPNIGGTKKSDQIKKSNRILKDLEETMKKDMSPEMRAKGEKITDSGVSKGKDMKAKGGRVGYKKGTPNPFARKSKLKKIQEAFKVTPSFMTVKKEKPKKRLMAKKGSPDPKKKKKKFPDLTGDGKVTFADVLKGRGVINGKKKTKKKII